MRVDRKIRVVALLCILESSPPIFLYFWLGLRLLLGLIGCRDECDFVDIDIVYVVVDRSVIVLLGITLLGLFSFARGEVLLFGGLFRRRFPLDGLDCLKLIEVELLWLFVLFCDRILWFEMVFFWFGCLGNGNSLLLLCLR